MLLIQFVIKIYMLKYINKMNESEKGCKVREVKEREE